MSSSTLLFMCSCFAKISQGRNVQSRYESGQGKTIATKVLQWGWSTGSRRLRDGFLPENGVCFSLGKNYQYAHTETSRAKVYAFCSPFFDFFFAKVFEAAIRMLDENSTGTHRFCPFICCQNNQKQKLLNTKLERDTLEDITAKFCGQDKAVPGNKQAELLLTTLLSVARNVYLGASYLSGVTVKGVLLDSASHQRNLSESDSYIKFMRNGKTSFRQIQFFLINGAGDIFA